MIHGVLERAQIEPRTSDYANTITGIIWFRTDTGLLKIATGATVLEILTSASVIASSQISGELPTANIEDDAVTTPKIADNAVTTPKIAAGAVTLDKLSGANYTYGGLYFTYQTPSTGAGAYTISAMARSGGRVTVTLSASAANIRTGQLIDIALSTSTTDTFNGRHMVIGTSGNDCYFMQAGANESAGVGSATFNALQQWVPADTAINISSIERSANVVTVVMAGYRPYPRVNQYICISGATAGFNGTHKVTSTDGVTLTFAQTGANEVGAAAGTVSNMLIMDVTTVAGRPVEIMFYGGTYGTVQSVGSALHVTPRIYRDGIASVNLLTSGSHSLFTTNTVSETPANAFVAASSGGAVTSALAIGVTTTTADYLPSGAYTTIDNDEVTGIDGLPAGTYTYYVTLDAGSAYALTAGILSTKMLLREI